MSIEKLEVELKLTVSHINTILAHLAKGAYSEVSDLIAHLRGQVIPQVQAAQAPAPVPAPAEPAPAPAEPVPAETPPAEPAPAQQ